MKERRVDWVKLPSTETKLPVVEDGSASSPMVALLATFDDMLGCDDIDLLLKRAVEFARERLGLVRAAIYLRHEAEGVMRGTWGTQSDGTTVDEHNITFRIWNGDKAYHEGLAREGVYWTALDNVPLVEHLPSETREFAEGWVCCTPIRSGPELLGMMFNDAGGTQSPIDDGQQSQVAVLCSLLGTALERARRRGETANTERGAAHSAVVVRVARLLAKDPAMTAEALGSQIHLSASRIARLFKAEMGMSLVQYRNRLKLERFASLLDQKGENLLEAALAAGFGSYAQFHRVFMTERGTTPGKFVRSRVMRQK